MDSATRDHVIRMAREAENRLHDADVLATTLDVRSDSQMLIRVLAFEVLLKAALLTATGRVRRVHDYRRLWAMLPAGVRTVVLATAQRRMPGHADLSDLDKLLLGFQFIFEKARYHYELYEGYSLIEQRELGELWLDLGAPTEEAVVQYFPLELRCLTEALLAYVKDAVGLP